MRILICTLASCFFLTSTAHAEENRNIQNAYLIEGLKHFETKSYEKAIQLFQTGYELDPKPEFLFALGQAERLSGDCRSAIVYYKDFQTSKASDQAKKAAKQQQDKCTAALGSNPVVAKTSKVIPKSQLNLNARPIAPKEANGPALNFQSEQSKTIKRKAWYKDWAGGLLLGAGVTAGVGSIYLFQQSNNQLTAANDASNYQNYESSVNDARFTRKLSFGAAALGAAFLTGAAWRYKTHDREIVEKVTHMSFSYGKNRAMFSYENKF